MRRIDCRKNMNKVSKSFTLGFVLTMICLLPLSAQTATAAPADSKTAAATPAPTAQAPDDMTKKISDLVHNGKYAEAQQLTTGLLVAYPDDQRLIKAKALLDRLLAPGGSANAVPDGSQPRYNEASAQPVDGAKAQPLTGMDRVDYSALIVLARQAQQETDLEQQKASLKQFMDQSDVFLQKHPDQLLLWQLRAASAISLNEPMAGYEAGQKLLTLGAADSNDPNLQVLLGQLKNKGWLDRRGAEEAQHLAQAREVAERFRGVWYWWVAVMAPKSEASMKAGITEAEIAKRGFLPLGWFLADSHAGRDTEFEIGSDGTITVRTRTSYAACEGNVYGVPQGPLFTNVRWEVRPLGGSPRQIWSNSGPDGTWFAFSCNRPLSATIDNNVRYNMLYWSRNK